MFRTTLTAVLLVALPQLVSAQPTPAPQSEIERLAVQAGVDHSLRGEPQRVIRLAINPTIAPTDEAPPSRGTKRRDVARQNYLLYSFKAASLPPEAAVDCSTKPCKFRHADVIVSLSEPQISADEASVTVTVLRADRNSRSLGKGRKPPSGMSYVTVNVVLQRGGLGWKVVRLEELGIS